MSGAHPVGLENFSVLALPCLNVPVTVTVDTFPHPPVDGNDTDTGAAPSKPSCALRGVESPFT